MKWTRMNSEEEFKDFPRGRIVRSEFPMGGYIYRAYTHGDTKWRYHGNDLKQAVALVTDPSERS